LLSMLGGAGEDRAVELECGCQLIICSRPRKMKGNLLDLVGHRILRVLFIPIRQFDTEIYEIYILFFRVRLLRFEIAEIHYTEVSFLYSDE